MLLKLWLSKKIAMIELIRRNRRCQEIVRTKASDPLFEQPLNSNDKYCFPDYGFPMLIARWSMLIRSFDTQQTIRCIIIFKNTYCSLELFFFSIVRYHVTRVSYLIFLSSFIFLRAPAFYNPYYRAILYYSNYPYTSISTAEQR